MHYYGELYGKAGSRSYFPTGKSGKDWDELEKERDQLRDAIRKAATEFKAVKWGWDGDCGTDEIMERLEAHLPENDERVHPYQRRRTSITGWRL